MKRSRLLVLIALIVTSLSCRDEDPVSKNDKKVKFDIQGNFSGKLLILYTNSTGGNKTINDVSLPWSLEQSFPNAPASIGIGAQSSVAGKPGETATLKIFVDGNEVKSSSAMAGSLGELVIPAVAHSL